MTSVIRTAVQDIPPIGRAEAARLAQAEYQRFLDMLRGLEPDDWGRPTDCTRWTVQDVAAHIVGETEADAKVGRISYASPLGRALIGRGKGEEIEFAAPSGDKYYEIKKIEFI